MENVSVVDLVFANPTWLKEKRGHKASEHMGRVSTLVWRAVGSREALPMIVGSLIPSLHTC